MQFNVVYGYCSTGIFRQLLSHELNYFNQTNLSRIISHIFTLNLSEFSVCNKSDRKAADTNVYYSPTICT